MHKTGKKNATKKTKKRGPKGSTREEKKTCKEKGKRGCENKRNYLLSNRGGG